MNSKIIYAFILLFFALNGFAQPSLPDTGYRWVLNQELSDEFEGDELDLEKWKNTDPNRWIGRTPGLFMAEAVSMGEGKMRMTCDIFDEPKEVKGQTWTHQGGHVISQKQVKPGSFIECKMKANKTFMSTTFWLINYSNEGTGCDRRVTELDVHESIGYPENHAKTQQMGSNTHSRGIPSECSEIEAGSRGNHAQAPGKLYDHYYTYGVWWKGPRELLFYLNGEYKYTINPVADFDIDLYIKLVCETYNWSPAPADGGMTGTWEERTTFYDWVRTYDYVAVDEPSGTGDNSNSIFDEEINFTSKPSKRINTNLSFKINYKANSDRKLTLELKNELGDVVGKLESLIYQGYGNMEVALDAPEAHGYHTVVASLIDLSNGNSLSSTEYKVEVVWPTTVDNLDFKNISIVPNPTNKSVWVRGLNEATKYEIHTISGQKLSTGITDEMASAIDVSFLPPATYMLKLISDSNVMSYKFVRSN